MVLKIVSFRQESSKILFPLKVTVFKWTAKNKSWDHPVYTVVFHSVFREQLENEVAGEKNCRDIFCQKSDFAFQEPMSRHCDTILPWNTIPNFVVLYRNLQSKDHPILHRKSGCEFYLRTSRSRDIGLVASHRGQCWSRSWDILQELEELSLTWVSTECFQADISRTSRPKIPLEPFFRCRIGTWGTRNEHVGLQWGWLCVEGGTLRQPTFLVATLKRSIRAITDELSLPVTDHPSQAHVTYCSPPR